MLGAARVPAIIAAKVGNTVLYAILCYNSEAAVGAWTKEQDDAVMAKLSVVQDKLDKQGKLGPVARLRGTDTALTLRKDCVPFTVTDGPFAETKEQILGFYMVECAGQEEALEIARELGEANPGGSFELRPVSYFRPGPAS